MLGGLKHRTTLTVSLLLTAERMTVLRKEMSQSQCQGLPDRSTVARLVQDTRSSYHAHQVAGLCLDSP